MQDRNAGRSEERWHTEITDRKGFSLILLVLLPSMVTAFSVVALRADIFPTKHFEGVD